MARTSGHPQGTFFAPQANGGEVQLAPDNTFTIPPGEDLSADLEPSVGQEAMQVVMLLQYEDHALELLNRASRFEQANARNQGDYTKEVASLVLGAKTDYARSIGIEVERKQEYARHADGTIKIKDGKPVVFGAYLVTADPERQDELHHHFEVFRERYAFSSERQKRREEIKKEIAHRQNPHMVDIHIEQTVLPQKNVIIGLNRSLGRVANRLPASFEYDPQEYSNLAVLAGRIGVAMASLEGVSSNSDPALELDQEAFAAALPAQLDIGLYIPWQRRRTSPGAVFMNDSTCVMTLPGEEVPGQQLPETGVMFNAAEYEAIGQNPNAIGHRAYMGVMRNGESVHVHEPVQSAARRGSGKAVEKKLDKAWEMDQVYKRDIKFLRTVMRQMDEVSKSTEPTEVKFDVNQNLIAELIRLDQLVQGAAEVAVQSLGYDPDKKDATHRAWAARMYRGASTADTARGIYQGAEWALRYTGAKRGKFNQSYNGCMFELYGPKETRTAPAA